MFYSILKFFLGPIVRQVWVKKVEGLENLPQNCSYIIAANHESYFDFICLAAIFPKKVYFLAGEVFFKKWWWRPFVKMTGQIMVDRSSSDKKKSIYEALNYLKDNKIIAIFPEGTRSPDGKLKKAYNGAVKISLESGVPIVPVGIVGTFEIMSRFDKYPKFRKCIISFGEPINLNDYLNNEKEDVFGFLTHKVLMKKIAELVGESYDYE